MIFLSAFKSSSHFSNAPRSFCLFSAVDSGDAGAAGITFSPINRATKAGGVRKFAGELAEFDSRISAGSVGLLWTSHENRRTAPAASISAVLADVWNFVGDEASFLSCFRPKVRNFRRRWYLQTKWKMPDMQPMALAAWWFSGVASRREDDDRRVSCLFMMRLYNYNYVRVLAGFWFREL